MKKVICSLILSVLFMTTSCADKKSPDDSSSVNNWKALYKSKLEEFMNSDEYYADNDLVYGSRFDIADITGDDIPELFVSASNAHVFQCGIYTIKDEKLQYIGEYGSFGSVMYNEKQKFVCSEYTGQGVTTASIYSFQNGEEETIISYNNNYGSAESEDKVVYTINGKAVSYEEYNKNLEPYNVLEWVELGRKYSFTEENIKLTDF